MLLDVLGVAALLPEHLRQGLSGSSTPRGPALGGGSRLHRGRAQELPSQTGLGWALPSQHWHPPWSSHGPASQKVVSADIHTRKVQSIPQSTMIPARERILSASPP